MGQDVSSTSAVVYQATLPVKGWRHPLGVFQLPQKSCISAAWSMLAVGSIPYSSPLGLKAGLKGLSSHLAHPLLLFELSPYTLQLYPPTDVRAVHCPEHAQTAPTADRAAHDQSPFVPAHRPATG